MPDDQRIGAHQDNPCVRRIIHMMITRATQRCHEEGIPLELFQQYLIECQQMNAKYTVLQAIIYTFDRIKAEMKNP